MTSRRVLKAAEAIREVVSMAILADLKDPRIGHVTVTYVEVSGDMRQAKVHVSVMGDEKQQRLSLHGLQSAAGYLQRKVSDRIDTRYTPRLEFVLDQGVKKSIEIAQLLREVLPPEAPADPGADHASRDPAGEDTASQDEAGEDQASDEAAWEESAEEDSGEEWNNQERNNLQ